MLKACTLTAESEQYKSAALSLNIQKLIQTAINKFKLDDRLLTYLASTCSRNFRKYAHVVEYFLLGIAASLLLKKSKSRGLKSFALCAVISVADQSLKLLVPGREFDWTDFPYDAVGIVSGIASLQIVSIMKRISYNDVMSKENYQKNG